MKKHKESKPNRAIIAIATILFQTFFIAILNLQLYLTIPKGSAFRGFLPFANIIVMFLCVLSLISIQHISNMAEKKAEVNLLKNHLKQIEELVKTIHGYQHEYARHLQTIHSMLFLGEVSEAEAYLDGLISDYPVIQDVAYIGDLALSTLLHAKQKVAESHNIKFAYFFQYDLSQCGIASWDMCSIVGNLLDNAIEAAVEGPIPRRVTLETKPVGLGVKIEVHNSGNPIPPTISDHLFEEGFTTKNSVGRGYGLYLVNKLVSKYKGTVSFISEGNTTFTVWLSGRGGE
jgi:sensor histidine kinase regulating citrate/malate metabolism